VASVSPEVLRDFKVIWTFNGKRIRNAHGPELLISGAKEKYAGVYKAMVTDASGLLVSNEARVEVGSANLPQGSRATATSPDEPHLESREDCLFFNPERDTEPAQSDPGEKLQSMELPPLEPLDPVEPVQALEAMPDTSLEPNLDLALSAAPEADQPLDLSTDFSSLPDASEQEPLAAALKEESAEILLPNGLPSALPEGMAVSAEMAGAGPSPEKKRSVLSRLQNAFKRRRDAKNSAPSNDPEAA
jgi:hypothetical protein